MPTSSSAASSARRTGNGAKLDSIDGEMLGVQLTPAFEPRIGDAFGQQTVGDDGVDAIAEQRQVRVRPARLGDHHALGVHDEPHVGDRRIGQQLTHAVEPVVEATARGEHVVARHGQAR